MALGTPGEGRGGAKKAGTLNAFSGRERRRQRAPARLRSAGAPAIAQARAAGRAFGAYSAPGHRIRRAIVNQHIANPVRDQKR